VATGIVEALKILAGRPPSRWSCGWTANNVIEGRRIWTRRTTAGHTGGTRWTTRRQGRRACGCGADHVDLLNEHKGKVIVQGITGGEGTKHSTKMIAAGTNIVGG